ncbi:hypothetical protein GIY30_20735 [Gordonia sp. HNM0687]|uniref:Uncharacterized protein n=1 Tax=Gordonia mangrovi TaxID=2665643 RepID=A0A6L7GYF0_9ACTN|nr:hypothetical protein [Gordonia mangrovi]MXP23768.1 hypothetical protein [Gordonia mangrovi]UVF79822.1 hypothetical protein NWF22_08355 [Gordonia mangrovi]
MNVLILLALLIVILAPVAILIQRTEGWAPPRNRPPSGLGPDAERIRAELDLLFLQRRDSA